MTVVTDLASTCGIARNLYIKIDGVEPIFWQKHSLGEPAGWSRTIYSCLETPESASTNLNLDSLMVNLDAMSFSLIDFLDSNNKYYFAQLLAPYGWIYGTQSQLQFGTSRNQYLASSATSIPLQDASGLASSGTIYLGPETISYTGKSTNTLTGCTRGLYPCISDWHPEKPYLQPQIGEGDYLISASTRPYSIFGRNIALYVTTWDEDTDTWNNEANSKLLWAGVINDSVDFSEGVWQITCKNIISLMDKVIPTSTPSGVLRGLNLQCKDYHRHITIECYYNDVPIFIATTTLDSKMYLTIYEIFSDINTRLSTLWSEARTSFNNNVLSGTHWSFASKNALIQKVNNEDLYLDNVDWINNIAIIPLYLRVGQSDKENCKADWFVQYNNTAENVSFKIRLGEALAFCCGFPDTCYIEGTPSYIDNSEETIFINGINIHGKNNYCLIESPNNWAKSFTMLNPTNNNARIYVDESDYFWSNPGNNPFSLEGIVSLDKCFSTIGGNSQTAYIPYTSRTTDATYGDYLAITFNTKIQPQYFIGDLVYAGARVSDPDEEIDQCTVKNCYIPIYWKDTYRKIGPFEMLLYPMLSTGTVTVNHATYDACPPEVSIGIPSQMVDIDSFLDADKEIINSPFTNRQIYIQEKMSLNELLKRECMLFGYAMVWSNEKIRIKRIFSPRVDMAVASITENNIMSTAFPKISYSVGSVINRYVCEIDYDIFEAKNINTIIVRDYNSEILLGTIKEINIAHTGIPRGYATWENCKNNFLGRFCSYPSAELTILLSPNLANTIFAGDTISLTWDKIPDCFGNGTLTFTGYALVLSSRLDYNTWQTEVHLLLIPDASKQAIFAPSALVDKSATYGGWNSTSLELTVVNLYFGESGDPDDGSAFSNGDYIKIIERAPSDPTSPQEWGPLLINGSYANCIIPLDDGTTLSGWDENKEYIVTYADYANCTSTQKSSTAFQADSTTHKLDSTDEAKKWQ